MAGKVLKIGAPVLLFILVIVGFVAPIGPLPGFFIGGEKAAVPGTWEDTSKLHEIRLEVDKGMLPRVVVIWVVQIDGSLYVIGDKESGWVSMLDQGGPVRIRMKDQTYSMNANRVIDNWQPIMQAYQNKYIKDYPDIVAGFPTLEEAAGTMSVFQLTGV